MPSARFFGFLSLCLLATVASGQTITSAYPGAFVDISTTAPASQTFVQTDDSVFPITTTVGNGLFPAGAVGICSNGHVSAGAGTTSYSNVDILATGVPTGLSTTASGILCPFWDDLYPDGSTTRIWWQEISGVLYIQWLANHITDSTVGLNISFQVQVYSAPASGTPWIQYVYPDATFGGAAAINDNGLSATVGYVKGTNPLGANTKWSYLTASIPDGTVLSIFPPMLLAYTSPLGPGSIRFDIDNGPSLGTYYLAITLNGTGYPNGWFFGISPSFAEVVAQVNLGYPFVGPLDGSGHTTFGPIGGVPSGLTIYSIGLGFDTAVLDTPTLRTAPTSYVEP